MAIITPGTTSSNTGTPAVINTATAATDKTAASKTKADELKNQFLGILLTQLQNQNPLDPMDTKEFTGQLAQFSSLEQQIDTNSKLDKLLSSLQSNATTSAFTYIGKEATIESNMTTYQSGEADWEYVLAKDTKSVKLSVVDQTGKTVFQTTQSNMKEGIYGFKVSAADFNPPPAEGSILTLKIDAADKDGLTVANAVRTTVLIDGIETNKNGVDMRAGNLLFSMGDIVKVSTPKPAAPTPVAANPPAATEPDDTEPPEETPAT
jgi:flagellar basal-body rod modification protein FlgD